MAETSQLRITLVRSLAGRPEDQQATARALGLRKPRQVVLKPNNPQVRGMVQKIRHLVDVEETQ